ncbi:MAG: alpha/beta hydrolase [Cytophagales bacterium]|nr:alpha/beta hydrolase [Cytophagales bacterium]
MEIFLISVAILILLYALVTSIVYLRQEQLILNSKPLPNDYEFSFDAKFEELNLEVKRNVTLNALLFRVPNSKGVILFHHGKSDNLVRWGAFYKDFTKYGYDFFTYDYRSFGKSKGVLYQEMNLHRDARFCYNFLLKHYPSEKIIQFGRSFGTSIATRLARKVKSPLLILETPYISMRAMVERTVPYLPNALILKYPLRTDWFIRRVECPIHLIHGTEDELIPFEDSVRLKKLAKNGHLIEIPKGLHNDLNLIPLYHEKLSKILNDFHDENS